ENAYEDAGFMPDKGHACRLAQRPEVAARIVELRREQEEAVDASPYAVIAALVRMAKDAETLKTPAAAKEARLNLLEAHRLRLVLAEERQLERGRDGYGYR
ncbi:MAG: hypothetical protein ABI306_01790, partial [Caulobacteraceae bacterium]